MNTGNVSHPFWKETLVEEQILGSDRRSLLLARTSASAQTVSRPFMVMHISTKRCQHCQFRERSEPSDQPSDLLVQSRFPDDPNTTTFTLPSGHSWLRMRDSFSTTFFRFSWLSGVGKRLLYSSMTLFSIRARRGESSPYDF